MDGLNLRRCGVIGRRRSSLGVLVVLPLGERPQVERHRTLQSAHTENGRNQEWSRFFATSSWSTARGGTLIIKQQ